MVKTLNISLSNGLCLALGTPVVIRISDIPNDHPLILIAR